MTKTMTANQLIALGKRKERVSGNYYVKIGKEYYVVSNRTGSETPAKEVRSMMSALDIDRAPIYLWTGRSWKAQGLFTRIPILGNKRITWDTSGKKTVHLRTVK